MQRSSLPPTSPKHKRTIPIIVLNPGVKEVLLNDTKDFFKSEKRYADRGIPFWRGYLLHCLMLDIDTLSLSSSWICDATLATPTSRVSARGIVFLEDLDAAFTRSATRDSDSTGTPGGGQNKDRDVTELPEARRGPERRERTLALALGPAQRAGRRVCDEGRGDGRPCPTGRREHCLPGAFGKPLNAAELAFPAKEFADGCPDEIHSSPSLNGTTSSTLRTT
ncbi:hypothetical protein FIBSPDRAFT_878854 [Athelia psychrophila]|uniref:Uncharacterized protein n=1 Tax=Athelia psychrophila TaxID=1759441 RepID=A0A167UNS6_9AGAM|nr:hypothetical protein FIBSPDRAFT_878854 [Fibularhizoctonia sp. CBS 109695]